MEEFPEVVCSQKKFNHEHREFLDQIRMLRKWTLKAKASDNQIFQEIAREFRSFCDDIVDHDQRETEVFQSVFYTEIAASD